MHRIHVRTGIIEVPPVDQYDERPTHDVFVIPTGPGEEIVEIETFDMGYTVPPPAPVGQKRYRHKRRWRFRAVSVERVDVPTDSDVVVDIDDADEVMTMPQKDLKRLLGRPLSDG